MRGIILAGGTGSRLWPLTRAVSKQLLPIFDKPMIYYPLATLMSAGITKIMIITTPADRLQFYRQLGSGEELGIEIFYATQEHPRGIAEAFIIGSDFIAEESVALILGDNIFHGLNFHAEEIEGGWIFAYPVANPQDYGVVEISLFGDVLSLQEKPTEPRSRYAIPGLYMYDNSVVDVAASIRPSGRGELEITDINAEYLRRDQLLVNVLDRETMWLDAGTFTSLVAASEYVRVIEERQGSKIGCIEEVAWQQGFISDAQLVKLAEPLRNSGYGEYLLDILAEGK